MSDSRYDKFHWLNTAMAGAAYKRGKNLAMNQAKKIIEDVIHPSKPDAADQQWIILITETRYWLELSKAPKVELEECELNSIESKWAHGEHKAISALCNNIDKYMMRLSTKYKDNVKKKKESLDIDYR